MGGFHNPHDAAFFVRGLVTNDISNLESHKQKDEVAETF